jgi:hypothetical protein
MENITQRVHRHRPLKSSSLTDLCEETLFETTMMSLPNSTLNESLDTAELHKKIKTLTEQLDNTNQELNSAHLEIENLNSENFRLKMDLNKSLTTIENYKRVSITDQIIETPLSGRKKRKNKQNNSISSTSKSLTALQSERIQDRCEPTISNSRDSSHILSVKKTSETEKSDTKRKLCILSNRHYSGTLDCIKDTFSNEFEYCRCLLPNSRINQLFMNLKNRLLEFTMNDYCLIILGESDFKYNIVFFELINVIRD